MRGLLLRAETLRLPRRRASVPCASCSRRIATDVEQAVGAYGRDLAIALAVIGLCLTAAAAFQVGIGLAPLARLREGWRRSARARNSALDPGVPREVRPLVEEMNELLAAQEEALSRARARAGDLAHGLKTPLTVLSTVARGLGRSGRATTRRRSSRRSR